MSAALFEPPERFNIADYFLGDRIREGLGDRAALRLDDAQVSYAELERLACRYGNALLEAGLRRQQRVFLLLKDGVEFPAALFGILKIGGVAIMVNPAQKPDKLAALIDYCEPACALVDSTHLEALEGACAKADEPPRILTAGTEGSDHDSIEGLVAAAPEELSSVNTHRFDPAIWLFSGGTTGRPKAVVQTHQSFANTTECYAKRALGYGPDDVTLSIPKLYFGYATGSNLLFPLAVGGSAVLFPEHPTPEVVFDKIRRHRPTILINVPTMIHKMVDHPDAAEQDLSSIRFATSAGEALPAPLYHRWQETFGVELLDGLGTAEMWHIFLSNVPGAVRPGTLGRVVPGFEIKICDDDGNEIADGEVGRLWVRGDSRALGYWRNLEKTAQAFQGEWFVGGDLVSRDADGYVTYSGRSDDVLKVAGKWLAPQEVESCLMKHPGVAECAVVGIEDQAGLTKPYAFVLAKGEPAGLEDALKEHCLAHLQGYKHPRRVIVLDDFPRTHLGKIDRGRLKQLAGS